MSALSWGEPGRVADADSDTLAKFRARLEIYYNTPVEYETEFQTVFDKKTRWGGNDYEPGDAVDHEQARFFRQQGPWMLAEIFYPPTRANEGVDRATSAKLGYDGELLRQLQWNLFSGGEKPIGTIDSSEEKARDYQCIDQVFGMFLRGGIRTDRRITLREILDAPEKTRVALGESEDVEGHPCRVLNIEEPDEHATHKVWIDETAGHVFRRWEYRKSRPDGRQVVIDIKDMDFVRQENGWFPVSGKKCVYVIDETTGEIDMALDLFHCHTSYVRLKNVRFLAPFERKDFFLEFPPDTKVWDFTSEMHFVTDAQGELRPIADVKPLHDSATAQGIETGADSAPKQAVEPIASHQIAQEMTYPEVSRFFWRVLALVFGVLGAAILLLRYKKKGGRNRP